MTDRGAAQFLLPGHWWRVPLDDADGIDGSAEAFARSVLGRQDDRAVLRRELATELAEAAHAARAAGGQDFYFAREIVPGVPVPLALTVYWPELPPTPSHAHRLTAAESLRAALAETSIDADPETVDLLPAYAVVRTVHVHGQAEGIQNVDDLGRLAVSYWIVNPDAEVKDDARTMLLSFSSPLVNLRDQIIDLCDAVVSSVTWQEPVGTETR